MAIMVMNAARVNIAPIISTICCSANHDDMIEENTENSSVRVIIDENVFSSFGFCTV